jgi:hypothetical protein
VNAQPVDRTGCPARSDASGKPRHGDRNAFTKFDCRCPDAIEDERVYRKRLRQGRAQPRMVPALAAMRRLQGLAVLGYSPAVIAAQCGGTRANLERVRSGANKTVLACTEARVAAFCHTVPGLPLEGDASVNQVKNTAARNGWKPLLAWDDDTIDDPKALPRHRLSPQAYVVDPIELELAISGHLPRGRDKHHPKVIRAAVRHLTDVVALTAPEIAERLRIEERTVTRVRSALRSATTETQAA